MHTNSNRKIYEESRRRGNLIFKVELISKHKNLNLNLKLLAGNKLKILHNIGNIFDINLFDFSDCF